MRQRIGNFHDEAHGKPLRHFDWIAPVGTPINAHEIQNLIAPILVLHRPGDPDVQHGYAMTHAKPDGPVHVEIVLYEECADVKECPEGHKGTHQMRIDTPSADVLAKIKAVVGEHKGLRLGVTRAQDLAAFQELGRPGEVYNTALDILMDKQAASEEQNSVRAMASELPDVARAVIMAAYAEVAAEAQAIDPTVPIVEPAVLRRTLGG